MSEARVERIDGELVLIDPAAEGVAMAVGKHNCKATLELNADRVQHFKQRLTERGLSPSDAVIVVINVDSRFGGLGEVLMPGADWQPYRDRGEVPFARGLAARPPILNWLNNVDEDAARKLGAIQAVAVVVVDHNTIEVFEAP